jgi:hypothetical protein
MMNRKIIIPLIQKLENCELNQIISEDTSNSCSFDDLKQYCESELEKWVLDEIEKEGLPRPDEIGKTEFENGIPKVKSDIFYKPNIHIFVDGPPHLYPDVSMRDQSKREFLDLGLNQIVIELDFKDGKYITDRSIIEKEIIIKLKPIFEK